MAKDKIEQRKELAAKLGEAFIRREKLANELNKENAICAELANKMEKTK